MLPLSLSKISSQSGYVIVNPALQYIMLSMVLFFRLLTCVAPLLVIDTSAMVEWVLNGRNYHTFYRHNGYYDGIGKDLWLFLRSLKVADWNCLELRLRKGVEWYVQFSYSY